MKKKLPGTIWDNNGYWNWRVKLPGESKRKNLKLCRPAAKTAIPSSRPKSVAEKIAWKLLQEVEGRVLAKKETPQEFLSVEELCAAWAEHAKGYYRDIDGNVSREASAAANLVRPFLNKFRGKAVADLTHPDMIDLRDDIVAQGYCRSTVNKFIGMTKRMMAWALDDRLISAQTKAELTQVQRIAPFRSAAPEPKPVNPADDEAVDAVVKTLTPNMAAMVRLHRLTGMRPGEICEMTWTAIRKQGDLLVYRPHHHKNAYRGQVRVVCIGPRGQAILKGVVRNGPYCFSPIQSTLERYDILRAARKTKVQPSQVDRSSPEAVRKPHDHWDTIAYAKAIRRACKAAGVDHWSPNQLRHSFATDVRKHFGLAACKAVLGHTEGGGITDVYSRDAVEDEIIATARPAVLALG